MKTKITKLSPVADPVVRTALKEEYICGQEQDEEVSPFAGYWVVGVLESPIEVGRGIRMLRENRNGVIAMGIFATSPVVSVENDGITQEAIVKTTNSVYQVQYNYEG